MCDACRKPTLDGWTWVGKRGDISAPVMALCSECAPDPEAVLFRVTDRQASCAHADNHWVDSERQWVCLWCSYWYPIGETPEGCVVPEPLRCAVCGGKLLVPGRDITMEGDVVRHDDCRPYPQWGRSGRHA